MPFVLIIAGILFIIAGVWVMLHPNKANERRDKYRIKGKREYTSYAEGEMVMAGLLVILAGVFVIVIQVISLFS